MMKVSSITSTDLLPGITLQMMWQLISHLSKNEIRRQLIFIKGHQRTKVKKKFNVEFAYHQKMIQSKIQLFHLVSVLDQSNIFTWSALGSGWKGRNTKKRHLL